MSWILLCVAQGKNDVLSDFVRYLQVLQAHLKDFNGVLIVRLLMSDLTLQQRSFCVEESGLCKGP